MPLDPGVHDLAGLIEYQEGAVVSRQLAKAAGGSVTLFAFDGGEGLSEHTTPHDAILQVLEGTARVTVDGMERTVTRGQVILLPGWIPHSVRAHERFKMLLAMVRADPRPGDAPS